MIASIGGRLTRLSPFPPFSFFFSSKGDSGSWELIGNFAPPTSINLSVLFGINSLLVIKFRRQSGNGNSVQFNSGVSESND